MKGGTPTDNQNNKENQNQVVSETEVRRTEAEIKEGEPAEVTEEKTEQQKDAKQLEEKSVAVSPASPPPSIGSPREDFADDESDIHSILAAGEEQPKKEKEKAVETTPKEEGGFSKLRRQATNFWESRKKDPVASSSPASTFSSSSASLETSTAQEPKKAAALTDFFSNLTAKKETPKQELPAVTGEVTAQEQVLGENKDRDETTVSSSSTSSASTTTTAANILGKIFSKKTPEPTPKIEATNQESATQINTEKLQEEAPLQVKEAENLVSNASSEEAAPTNDNLLQKAGKFFQQKRIQAEQFVSKTTEEAGQLAQQGKEMFEHKTTIPAVTEYPEQVANSFLRQLVADVSIDTELIVSLQQHYKTIRNVNIREKEVVEESRRSNIAMVVTDDSSASTSSSSKKEKKKESWRNRVIEFGASNVPREIPKYDKEKEMLVQDDQPKRYTIQERPEENKEKVKRVLKGQKRPLEFHATEETKAKQREKEILNAKLEQEKMSGIKVDTAKILEQRSEEREGQQQEQPQLMKKRLRNKGSMRALKREPRESKKSSVSDVESLSDTSESSFHSSSDTEASLAKQIPVSKVLQDAFQSFFRNGASKVLEDLIIQLRDIKPNDPRSFQNDFIKISGGEEELALRKGALKDFTETISTLLTGIKEDFDKGLISGAQLRSMLSILQSVIENHTEVSEEQKKKIGRTKSFFGKPKEGNEQEEIAVEEAPIDKVTITIIKESLPLRLQGICKFIADEENEQKQYLAHRAAVMEKMEVKLEETLLASYQPANAEASGSNAVANKATPATKNSDKLKEILRDCEAAEQAFDKEVKTALAFWENARPTSDTQERHFKEQGEFVAEKIARIKQEVEIVKTRFSSLKTSLQKEITKEVAKEKEPLESVKAFLRETPQPNVSEAALGLIPLEQFDKALFVPYTGVQVKVSDPKLAQIIADNNWVNAYHEKNKNEGTKFREDLEELQPSNKLSTFRDVNTLVIRETMRDVIGKRKPIFEDIEKGARDQARYKVTAKRKEKVEEMAPSQVTITYKKKEGKDGEEKVVLQESDSFTALSDSARQVTKKDSRKNKEIAIEKEKEGEKNPFELIEERRKQKIVLLYEQERRDRRDKGLIKELKEKRQILQGKHLGVVSKNKAEWREEKEEHEEALREKAKQSKLEEITFYNNLVLQAYTDYTSFFADPNNPRLNPSMVKRHGEEGVERAKRLGLDIGEQFKNSQEEHADLEKILENCQLILSEYIEKAEGNYNNSSFKTCLLNQMINSTKEQRKFLFSNEELVPLEEFERQISNAEADWVLSHDIYGLEGKQIVVTTPEKRIELLAAVAVNLKLGSGGVVNKGERLPQTEEAIKRIQFDLYEEVVYNAVENYKKFFPVQANPRLNLTMGFTRHGKTGVERAEDLNKEIGGVQISQVNLEGINKGIAARQRILGQYITTAEGNYNDDSFKTSLLTEMLNSEGRQHFFAKSDLEQINAFANDTSKPSDLFKLNSKGKIIVKDELQRIAMLDRVEEHLAQRHSPNSELLKRVVLKAIDAYEMHSNRLGGMVGRLKHGTGLGRIGEIKAILEKPLWYIDPKLFAADGDFSKNIERGSNQKSGFIDALIYMYQKMVREGDEEYKYDDAFVEFKHQYPEEYAKQFVREKIFDAMKPLTSKAETVEERKGSSVSMSNSGGSGSGTQGGK